MDLPVFAGGWLEALGLSGTLVGFPMGSPDLPRGGSARCSQRLCKRYLLNGMFFAEHLKLRFTLFFNAFDASLNDRRCCCNLGYVGDLTYDRDEVFKRFKRSQKSWDSDTTKSFSRNVKSGL